MGFYETLSRYYDQLFPLDHEILAFLEAELCGAERILDIACGTGIYAAALARRGRAVVGVDADASMLSKARERAPSLRFLEGKMESICEAVTGPFDAVLCIGNSLPHLPEVDAVRRFFDSVHRLLRPGGKLLIQIINFDRLAGKGLTRLPPLCGEDVSMTRRYAESKHPEAVDFTVDLTVREAGGSRRYAEATRLITRCH